MNQSIFSSLFSEPWYLDKPVRVIGSLAFNILLKNQEKKEEDYKATIQVASSTTISDENKKVAIIPLQGIVVKYGYGSTNQISALLDILEKDNGIAGVVFLSDTPGGMASGTGMLAEKINNYSKPTASYIKGLSCSAGYYINAATNRIFIDKNADWIGSIGVLISFLDWLPLFEKLGAKYYEIYASESTEKNKSFRDLLNGDEKLLQAEIDSYAQDFINHMNQFRPGMDKEVFKGGTWRPSEGIKKGLADEIGSLQDAINYVVEQSNINLNQKNMSEKTYPKIAAALGLTEITAKGGFLFGSKSVSLTEEQLDKLESNLSGDQSSEITRLQQVKKKAETSLTEKTNSLNTITELIKQSVSECKLKSTGSTEGDIKLLAEKVIEYGKLDGDIPTNILSEGDRVDVGADTDILNQDYKSLYI